MPTKDNTTQEPIAIIGMGCRFPGGASNPEQFWDLLSEGKDAVVDIPESRWNYRRFYDKNPAKPGKMYVKRGAFLTERIDEFDSHFFGISPREAATYDPQQRLLLEVSWEAMENAGIDPEKLAGTDTGVFIGGFMLDNFMTQISPTNYNYIGPHTATSFTMTILSNRLSYAYDLRGPSFTVDTACSSSLVAIHQACKAILSGECSMALAGGVNVMHRPEPFIVMCKGQMLAADGRSKSFDEKADGYGRGEGAGIIMLKPLSAAIRDNDPIQSVIMATGVNQDGQTQGITVPNPDSQERLINKVCSLAGIEARQIRYVEAHGTGTALGDPLEARALGRTVGDGRIKEPCILGSAKSSIGHMEAAAGVTGIIKSTLCLTKKQVPLQANLDNPNPKIPFAELGLQLAQQTMHLEDSDEPIYVGVNSFGYGGTNAFAVLRNPPPTLTPNVNPVKQSSPYLLLLSARDPSALKQVATNILSLLTSENPPKLENVAWSLAHGRTHHPHRITVSGWNSQEVINRLQELVADDSVAFNDIQPAYKDPQIKTVFVCSGMGPQWWKMGKELYRTESLYRDWVTQCDNLFIRMSGWSIAEEMLQEEAHSKISQTDIAQPANFVLQVGLALILKDRGICADAYVGHSVGEVSAAYLSGVLDLKSALLVSYHRSRIQRKAAGIGGMLAVGLSEEALSPYLADFDTAVSIAAVNGPAAVTLAGDSAALNSIADQLTQQDIFNRSLQVEVAYHSPTMDPLHDELIESLSQLQPTLPHTPLYSTVSGKRVKSLAYDNHYWFKNIRQSVRFQDAINNLINDDYKLFIELGPHPVLSHNIKECLKEAGSDGKTVASLNRKVGEQQSITDNIGCYYVAGGIIDYKRLYSHGNRILLPNYPWQRTTHWNESDESINHRLAPSLHPLLQQKLLQPGTVFETRINANYQDYIYDHKLNDLVVMPAAGYIEMALALAETHLEAKSCTLEDIQFNHALVIDSEDEPRVRITYDEQTRQYKIHSCAEGKTHKWTANCEGTISLTATGPLEAINRDIVDSRCGVSIDPAKLYAQLNSRGQNYGPYFQCITHLKYNETEVFGKIELPPHLDSETYLLHPSLLDSAFQSFLAVLNDNVYMPIEIDRLTCLAKPTGPVWVHGVVLQRDQYQAKGNLKLFDETGHVLVDVQGLTCKALNRGENAENAFAEISYATQWQTEAPPANVQANGQQWLVFVNDNTLSQDFLHELEKREDLNVTQVRKGNTYSRHPWGFEIGSNHQDLQEAVRIALLEGCDQLVYMWAIGTDRNDPAGIEDTADLLGTVKALASESANIRLSVITQGAQMVEPTQTFLSLQQSSIVGLTRVIANELPSLTVRLIDLDHYGADQAQLLDTLISGSDHDEIAFRNGERLVSYLQRNPLENRDFQRRRSTAETNYEVEVESTKQGFKLHARKAEDLAFRETDININVHALKLTPSNKPQWLEASGVITKVGSGVEGFKVGDCITGVFYAPPRSRITVSEDQMRATIKPARISHEDILNSLATYVDCYYALKALRGQNGPRKVLIHQADTLFGLAAVNIARQFGYEVFVTINDDNNADRLRSKGVEYIFSSNHLGFTRQILELTQGEGVNLVLNNLNHEFRLKSLSLLAPFGHFIECAELSTELANIPLSVLAKNIHITQLDTQSLLAFDPSQYAEIQARVAELMNCGLLEPLHREALSITAANTLLENSSVTDSTAEVLLNMQSEHPAWMLPQQKDRLLQGDDACYLVTGGLGGFGFETAKWLVGNGAKNLILVSRRGASTPEAKASVAELEALGCCVLAIAADIGVDESVRNMMSEIHEKMPPLKGVIHSAAVLDDDHLVNLDHHRMANVMTPKARGAWLLHQHTLSDNLDFFVLYSSISSLIGSPKQANYVAANAFLDHLSHYRQQLGLPGTTINWGAISSVGMAARNADTEKFLHSMGVYSLTPDDALEHLGKALREQPAQIAIMDVDWNKWAQFQPTGKLSPRFQLLVDRSTSEDTGENSKALQILALKSVEEKCNALLTELTEMLGQTLGLPVTRVYPNLSLVSMGVDSLLSMEYQARIKAQLGVTVSVLELLKSDNLMEISKCVLKAMDHKDDTNTALKPKIQDDAKDTETNRIQNALRQDDANLLLENIDQLSEDEIEALLLSMES